MTTARPTSGVEGGTAAPAPLGDELFRCLRCGFPVALRPWGCKDPCRNCGFPYPLGDCSD